MYRYYTKNGNIIVALLGMDLDRFKKVNDLLGHDVGDLILKKVSERFEGLLRSDDTVAHPGGDEFLTIPRTTMSVLLHLRFAPLPVYEIEELMLERKVLVVT